MNTVCKDNAKEETKTHTMTVVISKSRYASVSPSISRIEAHIQFLLGIITFSPVGPAI